MKRPVMHNRSLYQASLFPLLLLAAALMAACQPSGQSNTNASANANSSNTAAAPSGYIDLVGKWEGQAAGQPSTLTISSHMGETFTGTKTVGEYQIDIAGVVDLKTREITIRETNVKSGKSGYALGAGTGVIAPGGRQMSGEWKAKGAASSFSYSK